MPDLSDVRRWPRLSRRRFVAGAAGVLAARYLAACGGGEASAGWVQPPTRSSREGRLATELRVARAPVKMGGSEIVATTYEAQYPGPTIEVRAGEVLGIDLVNDLDQVTNLHTHGLHVSPQAPADDVLLSIEPGTTYAYSYPLPDDHPAGTFWYDAHHHTLADTQVFGGLFGFLIVRGDLDELPGIAGRTERLMAISQTQVVDGAIADGDSSPISEQVTLVNGQYQPTAEIAPGEVQRWRLLNASSTFMRLQLDGHVAHVVAVDGNSLESTSPQELIEIAPGARYDVLIEGGPAGDYQLQSLSQDDEGVFATSMVPMSQTLMTLRSRGERVTSEPIPTQLLAFESLRDATIDRRREFVLEEREPARHRAQRTLLVLHQRSAVRSPPRRRDHRARRYRGVALQEPHLRAPPNSHSRQPVRSRRP